MDWDSFFGEDRPLFLFKEEFEDGEKEAGFEASKRYMLEYREQQATNLENQAKRLKEMYNNGEKDDVIKRLEDSAKERRNQNWWLY